jgi:uracil-DNA glycosylase family 4
MERGGTYNPLDEPRFYDTQRNFRCALLKRTNAHMGGVATILSRLVDDKAPEVHAHQYALTNAVKCVWSTGTMNSTSTPEMARNCASHLRAELDLLQPHLIVTQGGHPRHTLLGLLPELSEVAVFVGPRRKAQVFSSRRVVVLATPHPARCPGFRYKADVLPVFLEAAVARTRDEVKSLQREAAG